MKKVFFFLFIFSTINVVVFAQAKNSITANPVGLAFGIFNVQYETALNPGNSIAVRAQFVGYKIGSFSNSAIGFGGDYRFYINKNSVEGWWVAPTADVLFWTATASTEITATFIGFGGVTGYKWNWSGFALDVSGGFEYFTGKIVDLNFGGFAPILGVNLGYAW